MNNNLQNYQSKLEKQEDFSVSETAEIFNTLRKATDQETIASFLNAWLQKGYTSDEIATCAKILRDNCVKVRTKHKDFIDIVGTGGSRAKVFNVSTAVTFVVAGAGIAVAKHGNRAASSKTGSADALELLKVNIVAETELAQKCLDEIGICFMFAPKFHNLTKELALARKSLGKPTIFNLLGPLANPANAPFQLIGIWNKDLMKPMAEAIAKLGTKRTWLVHGEDGLDEITINGTTYVAEIENNQINYFTISPEDFGLKADALNNFENMTAQKSFKIIREVLGGSDAIGGALDIVLINSAAAIYLCGKTQDLKEAVKLAEKSIINGSAKRKLSDLIEATN